MKRIEIKQESIQLNIRNPQDELTRLIAEAEPKLARFLVRTWNAEAAAIKFDEISTAISEGLIPQSWADDWAEDYSKFVNETLQPEYLKAAELGGGTAQEGILDEFGDLEGIALPVDLASASTAVWLEGHSAELAVDLTQTQMQAVGAILKQVGDQGPFAAARFLRPAIGLTEAQSIAVANRRAALIEAGVKGKRLEQLTANYALKLKRLRANTIARTEMSFAYNRGILGAVDAYKKAGWISNKVVLVKEWLTAEDERVCPFCGPLDGTIVGFAGGSYIPEKFVTVAGEQVPRTLASVPAPPAHPQCRCSIAVLAVPIAVQGLAA